MIITGVTSGIGKALVEKYYYPIFDLAIAGNQQQSAQLINQINKVFNHDSRAAKIHNYSYQV